MSEEHLLAPWYITGKLDEAEARELDELAREDPEFASLLEEARREAAATVSVNEEAGPAPQAIWDRLERSIEQEKHASVRAKILGFIEAAKSSTSEFLAGLSKPQWQVVAAAAVAVCVIQAGAIGYLAYERQPSKYTTASGPRSIVQPGSAAFIVSFAPSATIGEINTLLDDAGASIVQGPNSDKLYRIGIANANVTKDEVYKRLRSSTAVQLILPEK